MNETMWTPERIEQFKTENGIDKVYLAFKPFPIDDKIWYDALGFEKDGVFWVAKGSRVAPVDPVRFGRCWEFSYRVELVDDGYIFDKTLKRDENLLTMESAARFVIGCDLIYEDVWREA